MIKSFFQVTKKKIHLIFIYKKDYRNNCSPKTIHHIFNLLITTNVIMYTLYYVVFV